MTNPNAHPLPRLTRSNGSAKILYSSCHELSALYTWLLKKPLHAKYVIMIQPFFYCLLAS